MTRFRGWSSTPAAARRITDLWQAAAPLTDWLGRHVGPSTLPPLPRR